MDVVDTAIKAVGGGVGGGRQLRLGWLGGEGKKFKFERNCKRFFRCTGRCMGNAEQGGIFWGEQRGVRGRRWPRPTN